MIKGELFIGLIYILGQSRYFEYYFRGIRKAFPKSLIPVIRPKNLENIYDIDGNVLGKICGIFLKHYPEEKDEIVENTIKALDSLKEEYIRSIIFEDRFLFNRKDLKLIEARTNLKVIDGKKILLTFLPLALKEIYSLLGEDSKNKEVLIIGDDEKETKEIIEAIYKEVGFVTITGPYSKDIADNIYETILEKTGLSIFYSKNIDKILKNYSIIINLIDDCSIDLSKIRKEAILFDFSASKDLKKNRVEKGRAIIEDFIFKEKNLKIKESKYLPTSVFSSMYEELADLNRGDLMGFYIDNNIYSIEEFIDKNIKNKGKL